MSVELMVALISATAALLVALLSVVLSARATQETARLQDKLERRRQQATKEELLEQVMSRYREPLLRAAFDLQSRIYYIVKQDFLARYLHQGSLAEQEYAWRNTLFVLAEYLGWVEILRRGVQFLDLGDVERNRRLVGRLEAIGTILSTDRQYPDSAFQLFRGQQRAVGELMMDPAVPSEGCAIPPVHWLCSVRRQDGAGARLRSVVCTAGHRRAAARGRSLGPLRAPSRLTARAVGPDRLPRRSADTLPAGAAHPAVKLKELLEG